MNENWYNQIIDDVEKELETNASNGLTNEQVESKRAKYGYNELKEGKKKSLFVKFLEQFKDFMVIVLIIAAIISAISWSNGLKMWQSCATCRSSCSTFRSTTNTRSPSRA